MISSVGKELLSNIVSNNDSQDEFHRSASQASNTFADSFKKIEYPSDTHLTIPQIDVQSKLSSSTSALFKRLPLQKQKLGHRKVNEHGLVTFKTIETSQICESLQLGIRCSISRSNVPERDVLMKDFEDIEITDFPAKGTNTMPAHRFDDFKFKTYAPNAFRYFRELFGIPTEDFLMSVGHKQLRELTNPGASGSVFYKTMDDRFIIKTVQQKESHFLRKLLPKYFMNLHQNPDTLLPKFYGLYCYICGVHRVRVVVMNNLLPSSSRIRIDLKFDLKGSSYKRKATKLEYNKSCPTLKDLDFVEHHPKGIYLESATYDSLMKTIKRDCTVLESFNIMDYSFLIGIHMFEYNSHYKKSSTSSSTKSNNEESSENKKEEETSLNQIKIEINEDDETLNINQEKNNKEQTNCERQLCMQNSIPTIKPNPNSFSNISILDQQLFINNPEQFGNTSGLCTYLPPDVISGRTADGQNILLFCGIIDILQSYELNKKLEHSFKSIITDGKTISVTRPDYYAIRFQDFLGNQVFKKDKSFLTNNLEVNPSLANNLNFLRRKINTPVMNSNFLTNSQIFQYSILLNSSSTNTFDNQSTYSFQSSIRSAPASNQNQIHMIRQTESGNMIFMNKFNKNLQDELIFRRNNLTLNSSITKERLLSRHGYLESINSITFDDRSILNSLISEDKTSNYLSPTSHKVNRLSEQNQNIVENEINKS